MMKTMYLEVLGWGDFRLQEGWMTGEMEKGGIDISHKDKHEGFYAGGCITREDAIRIRDFINECIEIWEKEK